MEGNRRDCPDKRRRYRRVGIMTIVTILVLAVGAAGYILTEEKIQKAQKISSLEVEHIPIENEGCEEMGKNPLRQGEYPEVTEAVEGYFARQQEEAAFVEAYEDMQIYTKLGKYRDTYVAFVRYGMRIKGVYTTVPGLDTVYVDKQDDGRYRVRGEIEDESVKAYVKGIAQHEDVQALMNDTQTAYQTAVQSDALLQEALIDLKNAYEDSTGS